MSEPSAICIENEEQADAAIDAVVRWLSGYREPREPRIPGFGGVSLEESRAADVARSYAGAILDASDADGLGGCPLCQS